MKLEEWIDSAKYRKLVDFIDNVAREAKLNTDSFESPLRNYLLRTELVLNERYAKTDSKRDGYRFGHGEFRNFINSIREPDPSRHCGIPLDRLVRCFGSAERLDYGTGHELQFFMVMLEYCEQNPRISVSEFFYSCYPKYYRLCRTIIER